MNNLALIALIYVAIVGLAVLCIFISKTARRRREGKADLILKIILYNNQKTKGEFPMQVKVKDFLVATLGIVNHETQEAIDAKFANETFVSADASIVAVTLDPSDGPDTAVLDFDVLAIGEVELTVEVDATYIAPVTNAEVTHHKTVSVTMTVTAPVEEGATDLVLNFGPAKPVTDPAA